MIAWSDELPVCKMVANMQKWTFEYRFERENKTAGRSVASVDRLRSKMNKNACWSYPVQGGIESRACIKDEEWARSA